jgi:hypothetical protein
VSIRPEKIAFYMIPVGGRYDLELGAAMTELEVSMLGNSPLPVETLQIPERSLERLAGDRLITVWPEGQ